MNQKQLKKLEEKREEFKRKENFKVLSSNTQRLQRVTYEKRYLDLAKSRSLAEFRDSF